MADQKNSNVPPSDAENAKDDRSTEKLPLEQEPLDDQEDPDDDEDEEIFSNHPGQSHLEADDDLVDVAELEEVAALRGSFSELDEGDLEEDLERPQIKRPEVRVRPKNADELILNAVPQRARTAGDKLRVHLTGKTVISIRNTTERYLLDWSGPDMVASKASSDDADCKITLSEADLMKISTGDLNPQILMLSHKVSVSGKADHAIYIFNLIAPHSSL